MKQAIKATNRAIGYIRVSTDEQVRGGVSLDVQDERIRAYCTMAGLELVDVIREEGVSGGKPIGERPGGREAVRRLAAKEAHHLVALKLDRLFRDTADALHQTRAWDRAGTALHLVDMGGQTMNTASAMGRMMLTMMAALAELERGLISERTTAALGHKKTHRQAYSPTPFGYDRDAKALEANMDELAAIRQMKAWQESGWSLHRIAGALNDAGTPTKRGGKWYASTVRGMLMNDLHAA